MSETQTLSAYYRADGDPEGPVDHSNRRGACGFCGTSTPDDHTDACYNSREKFVTQAVNATRRSHQQWHWDTHKTACPWGCGDGSGIQTK